MADLTNLAAYLPDAKAQISLRSAPIVGNSFGGIVVSVGPDVFTFIVGDKKFALEKAESLSKLEEEANLDDASAIMINIATVVSVASIYMKLGSPLSPFPAPRSKDRKSKVLVYKGSTPLGALAVKYIMDLGHKVVTTSSPSSSDWVSRQGTKFIIDHTKLSAEVLSDWYPSCDGTPSLLADLEGGRNYFTDCLPLPNSPPLPPNTKRVFSSYYHAFTEENKELGKWV